MARPPLLNYLAGTGLGSGLAPVAPGTAGSIAALPVIWLTGFWFPHYGLFVFIFLLSLITILVAPSFEKAFGKDPGCLVSDEWAGLAIPLLAVDFTLSAENLLWVSAGFILFRFFDILKPLGIKKIQNMPAGYGVLMDDILAGVYALITLKFLIFIA